MALSTYQKVGRVVADGRFISRARAAVAAKALAMGSNAYDNPAFLLPVAIELGSHLDSVTADDEETIGAQLELAVNAIPDTAFDDAVEAVYAAVTGYIAPATGQAALAELAIDPRFQARVYQIIAAKANGVLAQAPVSESDPHYEANRLQRGFAMRLQAGLYLSPQFKQNFAINVLGAIGSVEAVTDAALSATIDGLLTLFVASRLELNASGKTLETVLDS